MARVIDVATHVLNMTGNVTTMKLQKLVYYCQARHLVAHGRPLFNEPIEAWANGPVVPVLFQAHKGLFMVSSSDLANAKRRSNLSASEKASIEKVVKALGGLSGEQLRAMTHGEDPWKNARVGLQPGESSSSRITTQAMLEYYSSTGRSNLAFA